MFRFFRKKQPAPTPDPSSAADHVDSTEAEPTHDQVEQDNQAPAPIIADQRGPTTDATVLSVTDGFESVPEPEPEPALKSGSK
jgi:hypothetical protein